MVKSSVTGDQVIGFSKVKVITGLKVKAFAGVGGEDVTNEQEPPPVFEFVLTTTGVETETTLANPVGPVWHMLITTFELPSHTNGVEKVWVFVPKTGK